MATAACRGRDGEQWKGPGATASKGSAVTELQEAADIHWLNSLAGEACLLVDSYRDLADGKAIAEVVGMIQGRAITRIDSQSVSCIEGVLEAMATGLGRSCMPPRLLQEEFPAKVRGGNPSACRHLVVFLRHLYAQQQQRPTGSRLSRCGGVGDDSGGGSGYKKDASGYETTSSKEEVGASLSLASSHVVESGGRGRGRQPVARNDKVGTLGCNKKFMKAGMKVTFSPSSGGGGGGGGSNTRVPRCEKASTRSGVGAVLSPGSRRVSGERRGSEVHPVAGSEGPPVLRANGSGDGAESAVDMGQSERIKVLRWMERLGVKVEWGWLTHDKSRCQEPLWNGELLCELAAAVDYAASGGRGLPLMELPSCPGRFVLRGTCGSSQRPSTATAKHNIKTALNAFKTMGGGWGGRGGGVSWLGSEETIMEGDFQEVWRLLECIYMAHARKRAHRRPVLGYGRSRSLPPARTVLAPPPPPPPPPQTIISAMNRRGDVLNIGENKLAGVSTRKHAARQQDGKGFTAVTDNATNANADADVISEVEDDLGAFNANAAVAVVAGCGSVKTGNHGPARQGIASPGVVARPRGGESTRAPPPHCSTSRSQQQTHSPPPPPPWARVAQLRTRLRSPSGRSSSQRCKISATKKNAAWRRENRRDYTTGRYNPIGMSTPMEVAVAHPTESVHVQAVSKSRGPPPETAAAEASTTAMQTQVSVVESANTGSPAAVVGDPEQVRQGKNSSSGDMSTSTGVRAKLISDSGYISSKASILEHAANGGISGGTDHGSKGKRGKSPDRMSVIRQRSADPPDGVRSDGGCGLEKWVGLTNRLKTVQQSVCRPRGSEQEPAGYPGHCDISDGKALLACTKHAAGMSSASGRIFTSTGGAAELETSNWLQWDPATRQGTHRARDDLWGSGLTERIGAAKADLSQTSGTVQLTTTRADGMEITVPTPERTTSRFGQQQKLPSFRPSTGDNFGGGAAAPGPDDNSLRPNDVGLFFRIPSDPQNISSSLPVIRPHRDIARNDVVRVADRSSGNMSALHDRNLVGGLPLDLARSPLPSDPFRRDAGTDLTPLFVQR